MLNPLISYDNTSTYTNISFSLARPSFVGREGALSNTGVEMTAIRAAYRLVTFVQPKPMLISAYRREGVAGVSRFVEDLVSSLLREVYSSYGLEFDGEISFFGLADARIIDEGTAVYLVATYMAVESLLEDLEEAEDLGDEDKVNEVLNKVADRLQELVDILTQLKSASEASIIEHRTGKLYQPSNYVMHV